MIIIEDFLSDLQKKDIRIWTEGERLKCDAPKGALTEDLRSQLAAYKTDIMEFLNKANTAVKSEASTIPSLKRDENLPISFAQQRLWFIDQLTPGNPAYNNPIAWRIKGKLNADILKQGLEILMTRHELLRSTFVLSESTPVLKISKSNQLPMTIEDLSHMDKSERENTAMKKVIAEARGPFNLATGPLFRVMLLKMDHDDYITVLHPHHIISDGWSWSVLFKELEMLYRGILQDEIPSLKPLPVQYADFAHWQRQWLKGEVLESRLSYWKKKLNNTPPLLKLPIDYPRPQIQTYEGARISTGFSPVHTEKLKQIGQKEGASLFMTLLSLMKVLFYYYTESEDICVGTPTASRNRPELENIIGFFVNTLVLRNKLNKDMTFAKLLASVKKTCLDAYTNQDIPFEKLVDELNVERNTGYAPLVQALFVMQDFRESDFRLPGLSVEPYQFDRGTIRFDLEIYLWEEENRLTGYFEYNKALFFPETVQRMIDNFHHITETLINSFENSINEIDCTIGTLTQLSPQEKKRVLFDFNDTKKEYDQMMTIHQLFMKQALITPENTAVIFNGAEISYKELDSMSNRLAHALRDEGITKGSFVGVILDRSIEMIISVLGILKAGGAYIPLEPYLPDGRIEKIVLSSDIFCLITDNANINRLMELTGRISVIQTIISMDTESYPAPSPGIKVVNKHSVLSKPDTPPEVISDPEDIAYTIFTSGSTGSPKGVVVKHKPVINLIEWVNNTFGINEEDKLLFITSLSFDLSVYDIFGILAAGGTIRLVGGNDLKEPERLLEIIYDEGITFWDSAPQALQQLTPFFPLSEEKKFKSKMKHIFLSGDWIPVPLPDAVKKVFPGVNVIALGGATEATVWSNYYPVDCVESWWPSIPYGRPIQNAKYYILNSSLKPCPVGVPGDLFIGGECLASGYMNDEELTSNKFIENPFIPGEKIYRTGDLARWFNDGNMEFLGRADFQVKIRGYRIELGEINSILLRHKSVKEAVVIAKKDSSGSNFLTAYYVAEKDSSGNSGDLTEEKLKSYLSKDLPHYMIPSYIIELNKMPLTSNGKLNREALPEPGCHLKTQENNHVLPSSEPQKTIASIWQQILKKDTIGINDNFFNIGGNSISIIEVNYKINSIFNKKISVVDMFNFLTIESLAEHIQNDSIGAEKARQEQEKRTEAINKSVEIMDKKMKILRRR